MTQQEQISILAEALQEVGKMPEWMIFVEEGALEKRVLCRGEWFNEPLPSMDAVLAALCGVAAEVIAEHGLAVLRREGCGECFDREDRDDCEDCGGKVAYEIIRHNWMHGSDELGTRDTYPEALAAAVRVAGKGGEG